MSDLAHCPFVNRSDPRCSKFLCLDRLGYAFEHCFDDYGSCPVYSQLQAERRSPRQGQADLRDVSPSPIPLTIAGRIPQPVAPRSRVLALFGL